MTIDPKWLNLAILWTGAAGVIATILAVFDLGQRRPWTLLLIVGGATAVAAVDLVSEERS